MFFRILVSAMVLLIGACATAPAYPVPGAWVLTSIDGESTIVGHSPYISFQPETRTVAVGASCNRHGGTYSQNADGSFVIDELEGTAMSCTMPGVDMQRYFREGRRFLAAITGGALRARVTASDELILYYRNGRSMRLRRAPATN